MYPNKQRGGIALGENKSNLRLGRIFEPISYPWVTCVQIFLIRPS